MVDERITLLAMRHLHYSFSSVQHDDFASLASKSCKIPPYSKCNYSALREIPHGSYSLNCLTHNIHTGICEFSGYLQLDQEDHEFSPYKSQQSVSTHKKDMKKILQLKTPWVFPHCAFRKISHQ